MSWTLGVDVGGTFTDFFIHNLSTGEIRVAKWPSTPANPAEAILQGINKLAKQRGIALEEISHLAHGTTVGTNALIQRKGGKVALLTTRGFRDLLEIGRQTRPHMYDLNKDNPPPLVPRHLRFELTERVAADGSVVTGIDRDQLRDVLRSVGDDPDIDACAVCLLFSFLNPGHEQQVAEIIRQRFGDRFPVSLSSEVQPEFREYERFSTTVLNAYLQPVMGKYIQDLKQGVLKSLTNARLGINQSAGGLMSADRTQAFPVRTALSGPAAGVVGAVYVAQSANRPNIITLDMGGTSADVALIRNYRADIAYERDVAGFPIRLPMVDIETVGAGGGSIAWFDRDGLLKVGPISAGADPGPACYGHGGDRPTVTDANLLLGRLSSGGLIGGEMTLDVELARRAFKPIAEELGSSVEQTALGVLGIVVSNMVRTIRTISVERGYDPKEFSLMPFGGAGPLHARDVAIELGMTEIVVPATPGIVCAQGLIVSDLKEDLVLSQRILVEQSLSDSAADVVAELLGRADHWFDEEQVAESDRELELRVDARYVGQNFELEVSVASGTQPASIAMPEPAKLRELFFAVHESTYGYFNPEDDVEIVNFRLTAKARRRWSPDQAAVDVRDDSPPVSSYRSVVFSELGPVNTAIIQRDQIMPGHALVGPAVVEQLDTTTLIFPGDRALMDNGENLIIGIGQATAAIQPDVNDAS